MAKNRIPTGVSKTGAREKANGKPCASVCGVDTIEDGTEAILAEAVPHDPAEQSAVSVPRKGRNPLRPGGFAGRIFDFLASLQLAVILLSILGLVCVAGTIYESSYTARLAQRLIYRTYWFDLLLTAIFVNVVFATLARFPWPFLKTGFLITHLGVLTILVGSLMTHRYGVEGQMLLQEGQSKDRIQLGNSFIGIQEVGSPIRHRFDTVEVEWGNPSPENPQVYEFRELGLKAIVDGFYPESDFEEVWENDGSAPNPAIHFAVENSGMGRLAEGWLAPGMLGRDRVPLGPAVFLAKTANDEHELARLLAPPPSRPQGDMGILELTMAESGATVSIDVARAMKEPVPVEGTELSVLVTEHMEAGYLNEVGVLAENPDRSPNPLVIFDVFRNGARFLSRQIEFAQFPDFNSMHDREAQVPFEATYRSGADTGRGGPELLLVLGPGEELHWKASGGAGASSTGTLEVGKPIPAPMLTAGMTLTVDSFLQHARVEEALVERPVKQGEFGAKAAHVRLVGEQGEEVALWQSMFNRQGGYEENRVRLAGKEYTVVYQADYLPLGFTLELKDFRLIHYPGAGNRPMSYESDVKVLTESGAETSTRDVTIRMNEPLDHRGYRVFQSSYQDIPKGDPQISIFSIARDPGVGIIYLGSIVLCLGITLMFYGKPYLKRIEARRSARAKEAAA